MKLSADHSPEPGDLNPYEPALIAALGEYRVSPNSGERAPSEGRLAELRALIRALHARLSPALKTKYANAVHEAVSRSEQGSKGSAVYEKVVKLFDESEQRTWRSDEVREALKRGGTEADNKAVLNVLGYLVRARRIRRVERGRYVIPEYGVLVESLDNLGGEPARNEGD